MAKQKDLQGLNVTGSTRLWVNEYGISTTISNKAQDGTYENMYITVRLVGDAKGTKVNNGDLFEIKDAFLSFNRHEKGDYVNLVVSDLEFLEEMDAPDAVRNRGGSRRR